MIVIEIRLTVFCEDEERVWLTDMGYGQLEDIKRANPDLNEQQLRGYIRELWPSTYFVRIDKTSDKSVYQALSDLLPMQSVSIHTVQNIEYRDVKQCQFNNF